MVFLERREFNDIVNNPKFVSEYWIPVDKLTLSALQIFASRYINPQDREVCRLLLKVGTGIGKTLTSLDAVKPFIQIFYHLFMKSEIARYINIIGYARQVFTRELQKYPELGIITYDELYKMKQHENKILNSTGVNKERFKAAYATFKQKIKKRITSEVLGGLFRFTGYKQLVNQLFDSGIPEGANQTNIYQLYKDKKIKVNKLALSKFKDSVMICDEIHQVYNSKEINNYGLAIQFILEYYGRSVTLISLSATILNNKAREIIDVANLHREPEKPLFKTEEFFSNNKPIKSLDPLYEAFWGKVIFLEESTADYPKLEYLGEPIEGIDYLKFILCPMSPLHQQTYLLDKLDENTTQHFMIHDMVLPNPDIPIDDLKLFHPNVYHKLSQSEKSRISHYKGLYDSDDAKRLIRNAPESWRKEVGIDIKDLPNKDYTFTGSFLEYKNLQIYSTKKCKLLDAIFDEMKENPYTKILNYHPYLKGSGISLTQEMFRYNGIIGYNDIPKSETLSSELYVTQAEWIKMYPNKEYFPSKVVTLDAEVTDKKKDEYIDEFNKQSNKFGKYIKIFNGSQKIRQSVDFKAVQKQNIEQCPTNIPELIQIKGRTVRRGALEGMPENMKSVRLSIFCNTYNDRKDDTLEMKRYRRKIEEFKLIQHIEYEINRTSCNSYLFYEKGFKQSDILGAKSFKPIVTTIDGPYSGKPEKLTEEYFGHSYYMNTLTEFTNIIKRAFITNSVWTYDNLWNLCCKTTMSNIILSDAKDIYNIALKKLVFIPGQSLVNMKDIIIFDNENYVIDKYYTNGVTYNMPRKVIVEVGKYYILTMVDTFGNLQLTPDCFLSKTPKHTYNTRIIDETKLKLSQNYIKKIVKKSAEFTKEQLEIYYYTFLLAFPKETHYYIMQDVIEIKNGIKKLDQLPKQYISTYKKIGLMGKNWYIDSVKKNVYEHDKWEIYPIQYDKRPDNDIIVGVIEDEHFKLRKPVLAEEYIRDKRTVERGMVCTSNVKEDLIKIVERLEAIKPAKISTFSLCNQVLIRLIDLEGLSRKSTSPKKYIIFI